MVASSLFLEGDWGNQEELAQTNIIIYIYILYMTMLHCIGCMLVTCITLSGFADFLC